MHYTAYITAEDKSKNNRRHFLDNRKAAYCREARNHTTKSYFLKERIGAPL